VQYLWEFLLHRRAELAALLILHALSAAGKGQQPFLSPSIAGKGADVTLSRVSFPAHTRLPTVIWSAPDIHVNGFFSVYGAQRGRVIQAAVVMEIPAGFHVNAHRPLNQYAIATALKIDASREITVGAVSYPGAKVRRLRSVNNEQLAVYEGRAILRFHFTVPGKFDERSITLKARLRFQSCSDDTCFPPETRDVSMTIPVVGANDRVSRIHRDIFGRKD